MSTREWTDEEVANMQKYGVCVVCWEPRYVEIVRDGESVTQRLTCKNGHDQ